MTPLQPEVLDAETVRPPKVGDAVLVTRNGVELPMLVTRAEGQGVGGWVLLDYADPEAQHPTCMEAVCVNYTPWVPYVATERGQGEGQWRHS